MKHTLINKLCERLVMGRFTIEELNVRLSKDFGCKVETFYYETQPCVKQDLPHLDEQLAFTLEDYEVDVDLWYLKDNGGKYYITEIAVNPF